MRVSRYTPLLPLALLCCLTACQGGSQSDPDAAFAADGAGSVADAQNSPDGSALPDANNTNADAGTLVDGGIILPDGSIVDGGGILDGGIVDDGGIDVDGGTSVGEVCQSACSKIAQCFGEDDPGCVGECSAQVGAECSPSELAQLDGCSNLPCDDFEGCLLSIPCIGGEPDQCGDGVCSSGEDCSNCAQDCGACSCGDGTCSPGECSTCASDCPGGCACGDVCSTGPAQDLSCGSCQDTVCSADSFCCQEEWDTLCIQEAEDLCGKDCPAFCGDGVCDPGEMQISCQDCFGPPPPNPIPPTPAPN